MGKIDIIEVAGHWVDEPDERIHWAHFGRIPIGYVGETEDLPGDDQILFWLEHDQPLVVGEDYGDFIVKLVIVEKGNNG